MRNDKKIILATVAVVFLVASTVSLTTSMPLSNNVIRASNTAANILGPSINVQEPLITATAAPGNSEPFNISVNVTQFASAIQSSESICGLKVSDFKIDTIKTPLMGAQVAIKSVTMVRNPDCNYLISIIPLSNPGKQSTWRNGIYTLQLNYLKDGKQLASCELNLPLDEPLRGDTKYWKAKGDALVAQKRLDEALRAYDQAVQIDTSNGDAWCCIGSVSKTLGYTSQSDQALARAKQLGYNCN